METVDELEAERDQQRDEQQNEGRIARDLGAGRVDIGVDAVGDEQQHRGDGAREDDGGHRIEGA